MKRVRIGVVGTGHLGSLHAKMLSSVAGAELVGVHDVDHSKASAVAGEHGTTAFAELDPLLDQLDAVSIVTTTNVHYDVAKRALEKGLHLFIEKPITDTVERGKDLINDAAKRNLKVQVGHIERFNPAILALEKYKLRPLFIESHRLAQFNPRGTDVGVVLDLMIHDIDLILSLVGSGVSQIDANGVAVVSDSVDIANARLRFENGCVANVTASRISQNKMRKMRLFQSDSYISVDLSQGVLDVFRLTKEGDPESRPTMLLGEIEKGRQKRMIVYEQPEIKEVNALHHELERFVRSILEDSEPPVTGKDGLQALEVARTIMKAIETQSQKTNS